MGARKRIRHEIRLVLSGSVNDNCLSKRDLQKKVETNTRCTRDQFREALEELCKEKEIRRKNANQYCLRDIWTVPGPPIEPVPVSCQVMAELSKAKESLTTRELAERVDLDVRQVYARCRRLEDKGYVTSGVKYDERRIFFAPLSGEVLHRGNRERIDLLYKKLRAIVADFSPGDLKTERRLQRFFADILKRREYAHRRMPINSFRGTLLRTIRRAEDKRDVDKILGLRPFHPKVRTWKSSIG